MLNNTLKLLIYMDNKTRTTRDIRTEMENTL